MHTYDIPAPLIYLLSGGIFLGILYLLLIYYLPKSVLRLARQAGLEIEQREFLLFAAAAFVVGVVVVFSNWQEAHFMIMYMFYISIYEVHMYNSIWPSQVTIQAIPEDYDMVLLPAEQEA